MGSSGNVSFFWRGCWWGWWGGRGECSFSFPLGGAEEDVIRPGCLSTLNLIFSYPSLILVLSALLFSSLSSSPLPSICAMAVHQAFALSLKLTYTPSALILSVSLPVILLLSLFFSFNHFHTLSLSLSLSLACSLFFSLFLQVMRGECFVSAQDQQD